MTEKLRNILIAIVTLLILALLAFWLLRRGSATQMPVKSPVVNGSPSAAPSTTQATNGSAPAAPSVAFSPVTPEQQVAQKNRNMTSFAMQFVNRYGSYSSEGNFQNLKDLQPSMTDAMWSRVEAVIKKGQSAAEFYGVMTTALAVNVMSPGAANASVVVSTRRSETKGTAAPRDFNQDIKLSLVKSDDQWLVDSAEWVSVAP